MDLTQLVSATLGLSPPWQVSALTLAENGQRLEVTLTCTTDRGTPCPCCEPRRETCEATTETWYHESFLRYATYLHARIPQTSCRGGFRFVERPWTRPGSKFVKIR